MACALAGAASSSSTTCEFRSERSSSSTRLSGYTTDCFGSHIGFDAIRKYNRACWAELWKGRIRLVGAEKRWQAMADAAFFYLISSAHPSSPASTSMFGLATWHDYHYYFGHVMWDIETFCVPPLIFLQPDAAEYPGLPITQSGVRSQ